jgi:hypothetical protein
MASPIRVRQFTSPVIALTILAGAVYCTEQRPVRFTQEIAWAGKGVWLKADTHVHTRFSDGSHTVDEVVSHAEQEGVDVLAITDHADRGLKAATPEYFSAIEAARIAHPRMAIICGVEWNIPPRDGDEHVTVLVAPGAERSLAEFKEPFDDLDREKHDAALATAGLTWLATRATAAGVRPVLIYDHPSRRDERSLDNVADITAWRRVNDLVVGFSGAPGHQGKPPIGSYSRTERPIDRWDPVAARVGDAWDTLLGSGMDVWAAHAPSDFHNANPGDLSDFWPGEFSETWLYAPDRSAVGALRALRAGSFFGAHGRIVREAELRVSAVGLPRPAGAGEAVLVPAGTPLSVTLRMQVPAQAWAEGANRIDLVEIIGIDASGARVLASSPPATTGPDALTLSVPVPPRGIVLRARGYRVLPDGSRLAFYTNPVRVRTSP